MRKEETVETVAQPRPRTEIYVYSVSFVEKEDGGGGGRAMDQYVNVSFRWHQNP